MNKITGYSNSKIPRYITENTYFDVLKQKKNNRSEIENLLLTINNSPIKEVINDDLQKAVKAQLSWRGLKIPPEEKDYNGVKFFMFNQPSPEYTEDFERLLNQYQEYFEKITPNKINKNGKPDICIQHYNENTRYPTIGQLSCIDYKKRRIRDYNKELSLTNNNKLLNFFKKRINKFDKCKSDLEGKNKIKLYNNNNLSLNYNENINTLNIPIREKIHKKYLKFFNIQKKKEKNIINEYNQFIQTVENTPNLLNSFKNQQIQNLKKERLSKLFNILKFGPKNKNFNSNLNKCIIQLNNKNKQNIFEMINKYILPQNKKIFLYGLAFYLNKLLGCRTLFTISPAIHLTGANVNLNNNSTNITTEKLCHKYIAWSPYLNYYYTISSLKKNMDIPLMIYIPQNKYKFLPKYRDQINTKEIIKNYNFIGVISIPFNVLNNTLNINYFYLFIFENKTGKRSIKNQLTGKYPHFLILNNSNYFISEGCIFPQNLTSYNELAYLYYLSKEDDIKPYFYKDDLFPFIMVSLNPNLENKYTDLKKVSIERCIQNNKQQLIFRYSNSNSMVNTNINYLKKNPDKYILATVPTIKYLNNL